MINNNKWHFNQSNNFKFKLPVLGTGAVERSGLLFIGAFEGPASMRSSSS